MRVTADLDAPCTPSVMYSWVASLERYPSWLTIVPRAVPLGEDAEGRPAWQVDLRGSIGPLARVKRLRMVRTEAVDGQRVVFERQEEDGRTHGRWWMIAVVAPVDDGCRLSIELSYEGRFSVALVERLLADEIDRSRAALLDLVASGPPA